MTAAENPAAPQLVRDERGLALVGGGMAVRADFAALLPRVRQGRLSQELLVRAARVRGAAAPRALDATAGLGEDAFLLAAAGFDVELYERDATIAALLRDGLARAAASEDPQLVVIVSRMHLHEEDSVAALRALAAAGAAAGDGAAVGDGSAAGAAGDGSAAGAGLGGSGLGGGTGRAPGVLEAGVPVPDVIYLDPMFPARRKSAAVKKKLQLLQQLERPATDEEAGELLRAALAAGPRKVVVKRPAKGPDLAGVKPSYRVTGKAVRFDVIAPASVSS